MAEEDPLLPPPPVAEQLGLSVGALASMRHEGRGPKYLKLSAKAVRYRQSDIDAWLATTVRTGTRD